MADIDTVTRDLALTTRSGLLVDPADATRQEVYLRLATERGSLLGQPLYGSELHYARRHMSPALPGVLEDMARDALQPMLDAGRLAALEVRAELVSRNRARLSVRAEDGAGRPLQFTHFVVV